MSNLIKEAIADAKPVREMAVKQARAALEEAFAPQVDAIISRRLQTEVGEDDEEEKLEEPVAEQEEEDEIEVEEAVELQADEHEKAKENSGLTEDEKSSEIGNSDNKQPSKLSSDDSTKDPGGVQDLQKGHDKAKESELTEQEEDDNDNVDLDEIIKELEAEAGEDELIDEPEVEKEQAGDEDDEKIEEPVAEQEEDDDKEETGDDQEIELEIEDDVTDDEKNLESEQAEEEDDEKALQVACKENVILKKKLATANEAISTYKKSLNEINILNAKLLFTNKVFSEYNLDDASKIKVIENFDRAKTVREVKLIFATLMENMKAEKRKVASKAQRLVEGASKAIGSTISEKANEKIVSEQDGEVKSRVHKLMGLKNK